MLLDSSGGLIYHWRALRYRKKLWAPFIQQIEEWLEEWNPRASRLLLIGPSAGYCLGSRFLSRFDEILYTEPDPVARLLLKTRAPSIRFRHLDLSKAILDPSPLAFYRALERLPDTAVLFSNLLGQISLSENKLQPWILQPHALKGVLGDRPWASFHDRISSDGEILQKKHASVEGALATRNLAEKFFASGSTVVDHETEALASGAADCRYWAWQITPTYKHVIEGVRAG